MKRGPNDFFQANMIHLPSSARVLGIGPEAPPSHLYTHAYLPPFETPSRSGFDFFPFNDHILVTLAHSPA